MWLPSDAIRARLAEVTSGFEPAQLPESDRRAPTAGGALAAEDKHCRTYWGSYGCDLPRGHDFPLHMSGGLDGDHLQSFHDDGERVWTAQYDSDDEDDPPTSPSEARDGWKLFGEDVP